MLAALGNAGAPLTIVELAQRLDVHPNTVRFHLVKLVAAGRVEPVPAERGGPGRPPQLFRAVAGMDPAGPRHYRLLAEVLLHDVATADESARRAEAAGRVWGSRLADPGAGGSVLDQLTGLLDDLGFAPEVGEPADVSITLTYCPFLDLVDIGPDLVCQVHLGLMRGAVDAWSGSGAGARTVARLEPFAAPDRCLVHLAPGAAA